MFVGVDWCWLSDDWLVINVISNDLGGTKAFHVETESPLHESPSFSLEGIKIPSRNNSRAFNSLPIIWFYMIGVQTIAGSRH